MRGTRSVDLQSDLCSFGSWSVVACTYTDVQRICRLLVPVGRPRSHRASFSECVQRIGGVATLDFAAGHVPIEYAACVLRTVLFPCGAWSPRLHSPMSFAGVFLSHWPRIAYAAVETGGRKGPCPSSWHRGFRGWSLHSIVRVLSLVLRMSLFAFVVSALKCWQAINIRLGSSTPQGASLY